MTFTALGDTAVVVGLGTGIDPMSIIDTIGADALRYTLLSQTGENQDLRYSERKTEEARNLANKIWNARRERPADFHLQPRHF